MGIKNFYSSYNGATNKCSVEAALASAKAAGYRIDLLAGALRGPVAASTAGKSPAPEAKSGHRKKPARKPKP